MIVQCSAVLSDLEGDLGCLKAWLDGIEDHLRGQMSQAWQYDELHAVLAEHKVITLTCDRGTCTAMCEVLGIRLGFFLGSNV